MCDVYELMYLLMFNLGIKKLYFLLYFGLQKLYKYRIEIEIYYIGWSKCFGYEGIQERIY